jgi:hypothetical protein
MAHVKPTSTKIGSIDENDVLTDLSYLLDGQDYGDLTYTTEMEGGSLRVTVSDEDGAERTFELSAREIREGE